MFPSRYFFVFTMLHILQRLKKIYWCQSKAPGIVTSLPTSKYAIGFCFLKYLTNTILCILLSKHGVNSGSLLLRLFKNLLSTVSRILWG